MADRKVAAAALVAFLLLDDEEKRKRGKTRKWIRRRKEKGAYANIVQELRLEDTDGFKEMLRMEYIRTSKCYITRQKCLNMFKNI